MAHNKRHPLQPLKLVTPVVARRILVVEDNIDNARMLALLFASMGHQVEYAINGIVALDVAHRFLPEIVFLDLKLPDAHGADVARQLRRNPALAATRIYAVTASRLDADHAAALEGGCEAVLMKPVPSAAFETLIDGA
jgi:CheY-like chemotaxis protein